MIIYRFFQKSLENGLVQNHENVLSRESDSVSKFMLSEEVRVALMDDQLFKEFYKQVNEF